MKKLLFILYWFFQICLLSSSWALDQGIYRFSGEQWETLQSPLREGRTLLILHGLYDTLESSSFQELANFLSQYYENVLGFEYQTENVNLYQIARVLVNDVNQLELSDTQSIDMISHSIGGIVTRQAIERLGLGKKVRLFISLGTPHTGIPETQSLKLCREVFRNSDRLTHLRENLSSIPSVRRMIDWYDSFPEDWKARDTEHLKPFPKAELADQMIRGSVFMKTLNQGISPYRDQIHYYSIQGMRQPSFLTDSAMTFILNLSPQIFPLVGSKWITSYPQNLETLKGPILRHHATYYGEFNHDGVFPHAFIENGEKKSCLGDSYLKAKSASFDGSIMLEGVGHFELRWSPQVADLLAHLLDKEAVRKW